MIPISTTSSALVLFNEALSKPLADMVEREGWLMRAACDRGEALRLAQLLRPSSLLMQIRNRAELPVCVRLMSALRARCEGMRVYAWSVRHDTDIERSVRRTGVHVYAAGAAGLTLIRDLMIQHVSAPTPNRICGPPPRARPPNTSTQHTN